MKYFVTGDRSMPLELAVPLVAIQMLKTVNADTSAQFVSGNCVGVEYAANLVAAISEISLFEQVQYDLTDSGRPDFEKLYSNLQVDRVVVIHGDLHSSRIYRHLVKAFDESKIEVVVPQLIMAGL